MAGRREMVARHQQRIRPELTPAEVDQAVEILLAAQAADWAPISYPPGAEAALHDRASYRYFWHVLERAHRTSYADAPQLPAAVREAFFQ